MTLFLYAVAGLSVLGSITALVLGWRHEPAGEALVEDEQKRNPDWRPACWVDDPMYTALGHVSQEWVSNQRRKS